MDGNRLAVRRDGCPCHAAALLSPATSRTSPAIRLPFSAFKALGAFLRREGLRSIALVMYIKDYEALVDLRDAGSTTQP